MKGERESIVPLNSSNGTKLSNQVCVCVPSGHVPGLDEMQLSRKSVSSYDSRSEEPAIASHLRLLCTNARQITHVCMISAARVASQIVRPLLKYRTHVNTIQG